MRKTLLSLLAFVLLSVMPAVAELQYSLQPVNFENGVIPSDWTQNTVPGITGATVNWSVVGTTDPTVAHPNGSHQGNYHLDIHSASNGIEGYKTTIISPAVNLTLPTVWDPVLRFSHAQIAKYGGFLDTLTVYYRQDASKPWSELVKYVQPDSKWTVENILLPGYTNGTAYQVAFEVYNRGGKGVMLDDIAIFNTSRCENATIEEVTGITYNSATLSYGSNGDHNTVDVAVSKTAIRDLSTLDTTKLAFYGHEDFETVLTGLESFTTYYVYIRTDCADNESGYTDWVSTMFTTAMLDTLPYVQDFNVAATSGYVLPDGWTSGNNIDPQDSVNAAKWHPYVPAAAGATYKGYYSVDASKYLVFAGAQSATAVSTTIPDSITMYAATPQLEAQLDTCQVSFWATAYNMITNGSDKVNAAEITVGVMSDPNDLGTFTAIKKVTIDHAYQHKHFVISLAGAPAGTQYVALASDATEKNIFFVDNLQVSKLTNTPEDVAVKNALPTGFDVTSAAANFDVKVFAEADYDYTNHGVIPATQPLYTATGANGTAHITLDKSVAGQALLVYVGVNGNYAFPATIRVPYEIPSMPDTIAFEASDLVLKTLGHEISAGFTSSTKTSSEIFFPLISDNYPKYEGSSTSPTYSGGHISLHGINNYFVLPYVEDLNGLEVLFRLSAGSATYAGQSRVKVGVMTDPYDLSTFDSIGVFNGADGTGAAAYLKCEQDFVGYTGHGHFIAFCAIKPGTVSSTYGSHNLIDEIIVKPVPTCRDAQSLVVTPGVTRASLSWDGARMTEWLVSVYQADSVVLDTIVATTPAVEVTGLQPNTAYTYSVQAICGTDTLPVDATAAFTTLIGIPYSNPLSDQSSYSRYSGLASAIFDGTASLTPATGWTTTTTAIGTSHPKCNIYGTSCKYWLVLPTLYLEAAANSVVTLKFDAAFTDYGNANVPESVGADDKFMVIISTDGGATWSSANATVWAGDGSGDYLLSDMSHNPTTYMIDLTSYIGQAVAIAFYAESTSSNADNDIHVANVSIKAVDANCAGVTRFATSAITSTSASLAWNAIGTQSLTYTVTSAAGTSAEVTTTDNPLVISGLTPNTQYIVDAWQTCDDIKQNAVSVTFRTECDAVTPARLGIIDFSDGDAALNCWKTVIGDTTGISSSAKAPYVSNETGYGRVLVMQKKANTSSYGYGHMYYAIMPELDIDSIQKYQVTFYAASNTPTTTYNYQKLYVGVVTDLSDLLTYETVDTLDIRYARDSAAMTPYTVGFDNYVEDYMGGQGKYITFMIDAPSDTLNQVIIDNISVDAVNACHQVNDMEVVSLTSDSVELQWTGSAANYLFAISDHAGKPDTMAVESFVYSANITATTIKVGGLTPNTSYYAFVRAICAEDDMAKWSGATAFHTECGSVSEFPWTENFDSLATGNLAIDCWNNYHSMGTASYVFQVDGSTEKGNSTKHLKLPDQQAGNQIRLELPFMSIDEANAYEFGFDMCRVSGTKQLEGVIVTAEFGDQVDTLIWVPRNMSASNKYVEAVTSDGWYTYFVTIPFSGNGHIVITGYSEYGNSSSLDNFIVRHLPSCPDPKKLKAVNATSSAATLTWEGTSPAYDLVVCEGADTIVVMRGLTTDSVLVSGLQPSTQYFAYVQGICGANDSTAVISATFKTAIGVPYAEALDAGVPSDWKRYTGLASAAFTGTAPTATTSGWTSQTSSTPSDMGNNLKVNIYGTGCKYWLATPAIDMTDTNMQIVNLTFNAAWTKYNNTSAPTETSSDDKFMVLVSTDNGATWDQSNAFIWANDGTGNMGLVDDIPAAPTQITLDFTRFIGQSVMVAFYGESTVSGGDNDFHINNVKLKEVLVGCEDPTATAITLVGLDNAVVTWNGDSAKTSIVRLAYDVDFTQVILDDTVTSGLVDTIYGLPHGSKIFAEVKQLCTGGHSTMWAKSTVPVITPCDPYENLPWSENFEEDPESQYDLPLCWTKVRKSPTNQSPYISTYSDALYFYGGGDTTGLVVALPEFATPVNQLTITLSYKATVNSSYSDYATLKVGYLTELDGAFNVLQVLDQTSNTTNVELILAEAPAAAKYVALAYTADETGTSNYGTAYVYSVGIVRTPNCSPVKKVFGANIERRAFDACWMPKVAADLYEVVVADSALSADALAAVTPVQVADTFYHVTGLTRGTEYYVYVRANCGAEDGVSAWESAVIRTKDLSFCGDIIVAEGNQQSEYAPVWGYYADSECRTQSIYPASMLSELVGQQINGLHYYVVSGTNASSWDGAPFYVRLAEVTQTTLNSVTGFYSGPYTSVYYGTLTANTTDDLVINFSQPFTYNGGNLLIEFQELYGTGYSHVYFQSMDATGATVYGYLDYSGDEVAYADPHLPTVGFNICYQSEACPAVTAATFDLIGDGTEAAQISWTASDGDFVGSYEFCFADNDTISPDSIAVHYTAIDSLSIAVAGLEEATTYYGYIRAICDAQGMNDGISTWFQTTFTTNEGCPAVKNIAATLTAKNAVTLTWDPAYAEQEKQFSYILTTDTLTDGELEASTAWIPVDTNVVAVSNLLYDQEYQLYVVSRCAGDISKVRSISFATQPECAPVTNLHTELIAFNAVELAWSAAPFATETAWEVGIVGQESQARIVTDTTALLIGLDGSTDYVAYVKALCSDSSFASASLAFTTEATPSQSLEIGNGTGSNYTAPFCNYYKNGWNQMIYSAAQVQHAGTIVSIAYHCAVPSSLTDDRTRVYMAHTSMSVATSSSAWVPEADLQLVYDGAVDHSVVGQDEWLEIVLDDPFIYNGTDNLAIIVSSMRQTYSNVLQYYFTTATNGATLYRQSDSYTNYADHPGTATGTQSAMLPNIQISFEQEACAKVANLKASGITTTSANISWFPGGAETSWNTFFSAAPLTDAQLNVAAFDTVADYTKSFTGLDIDADYYFYVRSFCSANERGKWSELHFITAANCVAPKGLTLDSITATSAYLHWASQAAESYVVAYGPTATFDISNPATFSTVAAADTVAVISGLNPVANYSFAVKALCSATESSRYCSPISAMTDCGPIAVLPYEQKFETAALCWDLTSAVTYSTAYSVSGRALSFSTTQTAYAVMPEFVSYENTKLTFSYRMGSTSSMTMGQITAGYLTDVSDKSTFVALTNALPRVYAFEEITVYLTDPIPAGARLAFKYSGATATTYAAYVDNVALQVYDPECDGFSDFSVSNVSNNSFIAHWSTVGAAAVDVFVTNPQDQVVFSTSAYTADSIVISDLQQNTEYTISVVQTCSLDTVSATVKTTLTLPFVSHFNMNTEQYDFAVQQVNGSIPWSIKVDSKFILGAMSDSVVAYNLYSTNASALFTPEIYLPVNTSEESILASALFGTLPYSTAAGPSTDESLQIIAIDVDADTVYYLKSFYGDGVQFVAADGEIVPWNDAAKVSVDLTPLAGRTVRYGVLLGHYGSKGSGTAADIWVVIDDLEIRKLSAFNYAATTCSGNDFADDYFLIASEDLVAGTTADFQVIASGERDTLVTISLSVNPSVEVIRYDTACYNQDYYDLGLEAPIRLTDADDRAEFRVTRLGCDSVIHHYVHVLPELRSETVVRACRADGYTLPSGEVIYTGRTFRDTLQSTSAFGCDSVVTMTVEFGDGTVDEQTIFLCAGDTYAWTGGAPIAEGGTYTDSALNVYGCDSVQILYVYAVDAAGNVSITISEDDLPYTAPNGQALSAATDPGTYPLGTVKTTCGNDAVITVVVEKHQEQGLFNIADDARAQKVFIRDIMYIVLDGRWYDAQGRLTAKPEMK